VTSALTTQDPQRINEGRNVVANDSERMRTSASSSTGWDAPFRLADHVALVTGGGQGIGREIVRTLAAAGADIVVADIVSTTAEEARREVEHLGRRALAVETNVADPTSVDSMTRLAIDAFGKIDILVNNAGICVNVPAVDMTADDWLRVVNINLNGAFWCSQSVGRHMVAAGRGSIVNIGSMSGSIVNWPQPQAAYNASKAAVIHLTKSLASEWAALGVRVNSVSPGYIGTEMTRRGMSTPGWGETWLSMTPMHRLGEPVDVARAVLYLVSDEAAFATGTDLIVDGGYTIW
jgi:NAD(P)-dependent dehydrogenase (short-subunit alcohol dehydrogenase family)